MTRAPEHDKALATVLDGFSRGLPLSTIAEELSLCLGSIGLPSDAQAVGAFLQSHEKDIVRHLNALAGSRQQEYYIHPFSGFLVFTSYYHQKRGTCCNNRCLHCPFGLSPLDSESK